MHRILLATTMIAGLGAASAVAAPLQEGRSTYLHHHHHASHHYHMIHRHHKTQPGHDVGGPDSRSTATGGNPGGFSTRN